MIFVAIYLLVGLLITALIDYVTRKRNRNILTVPEMIVSVLGWPIFITMSIFRNLARR